MARTKEQNQKIKDERKEQIVSAALHLFASKGLVETKIADISKSTGISMGLIYHYYASKEELFTELIANSLDRMNEAATGLNDLPLSAKEKIELAITELLKGFEQNKRAPEYYYLITQAALSEAVSDETKEMIAEKSKIKDEIMKHIFASGQQDGTVKEYPVEELNILFWSTITGLALSKSIRQNDFVMPGKDLVKAVFLK